MLTSIPNPMGASPETVRIGELAADFISALRASVAQLKHELQALQVSPASDERTRQAKQIASDLQFLQGIANASGQSLSSSWAEITSALHG